jgi:hypothetical protein
LLFENQYYRKGDATVKDLVDAQAQVEAKVVADLALEAATTWKLRHVPLALAAALAMRDDSRGLVRPLVKQIVNRADAETELLAIYARLNGIDPGHLKGHIPMAIKRGLADAFSKWDEYQLAKYDRARAIRLRDVMFLTHPKPSQERAPIWTRLAKQELATPDTWEVSLSGGADKKDTFIRLMNERKLGDVAFLRNLRNMLQSGVPIGLIDSEFDRRTFRQILPFQFIAASMENPALETSLDLAMQKAMANQTQLPGKSLIVVDVSGSMHGSLSLKSKLDRLDAAAALAILIRGSSESAVVYATAGNDGTMVHKTAMVPARNGMALRDAIKQSMEKLGGGGIFFTQCLKYVQDQPGSTDFARVIVITDEQDTDRVTERSPDRAPKMSDHNYIFNVGAYDIGLKAKAYWEVVTGFSEASVKYVAFAEQVHQQSSSTSSDEEEVDDAAD